MTERILQKIEHIRSLPEHIRLRYALGSVIVCMVFVVGIWMLTLKQGFREISPEVDQGKKQAEDALSGMDQTLPVKESLQNLKEQSESLRVKSKEETTDEFLDQEIQRKVQNQNPIEVPNQEAQ